MGFKALVEAEEKVLDRLYAGRTGFQISDYDPNMSDYPKLLLKDSRQPVPDMPITTDVDIMVIYSGSPDRHLIFPGKIPKSGWTGDFSIDVDTVVGAIGHTRTIKDVFPSPEGRPINIVVMDTRFNEAASALVRAYPAMESVL